MTSQAEFTRVSKGFGDDSGSETLRLRTDRFLNAPQPFDGQWQCDATATEITISRMGRFSLSRFLPALFFTVFWNGFTLTHFFLFMRAFSASETAPDFARWGLALFYVPFLLTGAGLCVGLGVLLLASWIREAWVLASHELRHERRFLCFRLIEKRDISETEVLRLKPDSLCFLNGEEAAALAVVPDLTQDEARWIASRFQALRRTNA